MAVIEPKAEPIIAPEEKTSPVLRDDDGGESHAPAFLKAPRTRTPKAEATPEPEASDDAPKPARRRRAPRSFEGGEEG